MGTIVLTYKALKLAKPKYEMPKSKERVSTSESDSDYEPKKKQKKTEEKKKSETPKNDRGEDLIDLGKMKYASVSTFKGKKMVNIREYYSDKSTGELKPGRKGITLLAEQWEKFKDLVPELDKQMK